MLARGRRAAERLMVDECLIARPGAAVTDPDTGNVTNEPGRTIYEGKCEVKSKETVAANPEAGEHSFTVVARVIKIPANAADVADGDVVTLTVTRHNAFTVGKQYKVDGFTPDSLETASRLPVKEFL
ncbi:hypothetical protein HWD94_04015 [Pseudarthrobacter equi]|uniref:DUF6093 family protein n=1 Tax=Pseudarthrobacter equi TaxID=728066 RepID=UPI0021C1FCCA|nr:DUF6093 family protein [Pseudarthrobacter equi]MCT9624289.1 hypothetical protein [Pseudarthrobacter equi]